MHGYWLLRKFFIEPPPYSDQLRVHSENCERKGGECMSLGGVRSPQRIFFLILDPEASFSPKSFFWSLQNYHEHILSYPAYSYGESWN